MGPDGGRLNFSRKTWTEFTTRVKSNRLDL